ncbi:hypothetical protein [Paenibacillus xerothermodurans]|uniref:hypothetical protein n=1 Tax=Paenibacillus xerothermodurans TaxID=1977292 RepID=UPI001401FAF5|nr:hypothetical protein [Paenibacillus xerothermodurans]
MMARDDNDKVAETPRVVDNGMDRIPIDDPLDNDNAFSDHGLHNARLTRAALNNENR